MVTLSLFFTQKSYALLPENLFLNDYLEIEQILYLQAITPNFKSVQTKLKDLTVEKLLTDPEKKIKKTFHVSKYFFSKVRFWFKIYSQYNSDHGVIHDKNNLDIIYDAIDFHELKQAPIKQIC